MDSTHLSIQETPPGQPLLLDIACDHLLCGIHKVPSCEEEKEVEYSSTSQPGPPNIGLRPSKDLDSKVAADQLPCLHNCIGSEGAPSFKSLKRET
jgi:hypothetical protein